MSKRKTEYFHINRRKEFKWPRSVTKIKLLIGIEKNKKTVKIPRPKDEHNTFIGSLFLEYNIYDVH